MLKKYLSPAIAAACLLALATQPALAGEPLSDNPDELIYTLATLGCADATKGEIETKLTEIGPEAELALWNALELGPSGDQLADRSNALSDAYQKRFGERSEYNKYAPEKLAKMHATTEDEYVAWRMERFVKKYESRARAALENVQYAREHQQGFWKQELYVDEVANDVAITAFPNPFRDQTTVQFTSSEDQRVSAAVYDLSGRQVASLFEGFASADQRYQFEFSGSELSNGTYVFRVTTSMGTHSKRLVLAR